MKPKAKVVPKAIPASKRFNERARLVILDSILSCFQQVVQWDDWSYDAKDNVVKYQCQAEVLIELLEADDCGSHGGFDKDSPVGRETSNRQFNRFLAVLRKYNTAQDLDEKRHGKVAYYEQYFAKDED